MKSGTVNYWVGIIILASALSFSCGYIFSHNDIKKDNPDNSKTALNLQTEQPKNDISIKGKDGATCTTSNEFVVVISDGHANNIEDLRYRVFCDDFDSKWVSNGTITIPGLDEPGAYTARVRVSDNAKNPNDGDIQEKTFTFFKL